MEKIKKYINGFFSRNKISAEYDMTASVWNELSKNAQSDPIEATGSAFLYGYAKGYRACMSDIKKGGVTA